jgi:hypothetical protein
LTDVDTTDVERHILDTEIKAMHLRAPNQLGSPLDDVGEAERRHKERDRWFVRQWPQYRALDGNADDDHDREGDRECERKGNAAFRQADEGQRREQEHRPLRKIEDAGCLVDQHETDRDQRIHHAGEKAADEDLGEEQPVEISHQMPSPFSFSGATPR